MKAISTVRIAVSAELFHSESFTRKVLPFGREYCCVAKWLHSHYICRNLVSFDHEKLFITTWHGVLAFMNTCVTSTTVQCGAVQVFLACHSVFYTEPCENSCMSFFKTRTSKKSVSSSWIWQAVSQGIWIAFSLAAWSHYLATNHRQAGGQEQYKRWLLRWLRVLLVPHRNSLELVNSTNRPLQQSRFELQ